MARPLVSLGLYAPALLAIGLAGCAGDSESAGTVPRVAVSGTVTLDGKPLPQGIIQFDPEAGDAGLNVVGNVVDGQFSLDKQKGPAPGKYRVSISSRRPHEIKPGEAPGGMPKSEPEKVPAKYNTRTTLSKEITADGPNELDFPLVSGS